MEREYGVKEKSASPMVDARSDGRNSKPILSHQSRQRPDRQSIGVHNALEGVRFIGLAIGQSPILGITRWEDTIDNMVDDRLPEVAAVVYDGGNAGHDQERTFCEQDVARLAGDGGEQALAHAGNIGDASVSPRCVVVIRARKAGKSKNSLFYAGEEEAGRGSFERKGR